MKKKILSILLALVFTATAAAGLCACGGSQDGSGNNQPPTTQNPDTGTKPPSSGDGNQGGNQGNEGGTTDPEQPKDEQKPVISFSMGTTVTAGDSLTVSYSVTDNVGVISEKVIVRNENQQDVTASVYNQSTKLFTAAEAGVYTVTVEAADAAGNTAVKTHTVTVTERTEEVSNFTLPSDPNYGNGVSVHDPSIFHDTAAGKYYVFGSHFAVASSDDLIHWTQLAGDGDAGKQLLYGRTDFRNVLVQSAQLMGGDQNTWAPDVEKIGNKYYMYYSLTSGFGSSRSVIGRVSADSPLGPYSNEEIIVWSTGTDNCPNCIDPELFRDKEGNLWLVYGSFFAGIYIKALDRNGLPVENGVHDYGTLLWKGSSNGAEGPFIFYNDETDYYYLMASDGSLSSDYNMRVARSKNPNGPYTDITGANMADAYGGGNKLAGNYQFADDPVGYAALGHNSVLKEDGKYFVVCHTRYYDAAKATHVSDGHNVLIKPLYFNEDGWPVLSPNRYANESLGKATAETVAGSYDVILHSTGNSVDFVGSSKYTLTRDGRILQGPFETGSWTLSGDYYITLTLNGTEYKGVVAPAWSTYGGALVSITATSASGRSLWANAGKAAQSPDSAGIHVLQALSGDRTNTKVEAFDASQGFAVSFRLASPIPAGTPNDWRAVAVKCGDLSVSLPNIEKGTAQLYPSVNGQNYNVNGAGWDCFLSSACYVTVSFGADGSVKYYKNGTLTQSYPATATMGGQTLGSVIGGMLTDVGTDGFHFATGANLSAYNLAITGAVTDSQAKWLYNNLG